MSGGPVVPKLGRRRTAAIGAAVGLAVFAVAMFGLSAGSPARDAEAQTCSGAFTIDFAGLSAGEIIGEQYASSGVHISGEANNNGPDALIVFDSNSSDSSLDADLRVGIGNIAIFANNLTDSNGDGLVDHPDENNFGGRAIFRFDQDVSIGSFKFIDKDAPPPDSAVAYDASGGVIKTVPIPQAGNGSVQTIAVDTDGVRRLEIVYGDSGGFTGIEVDCPQGPAPTPTTAAETATPTAPAGTPTEAAGSPTPTSGGVTPTPPGGASPTPTVAAAFATPAPEVGAQAPSGQPAAVAGQSAAPRQPTAVAGANALPAGGGPPSDHSTAWALPLLLTALVFGGALIWARRLER
jgi:hypothetical protein